MTAMQVMVEDVAVKMSAQLFEASHGSGQMPPAGKPATHNSVHLFHFPADLGKSACSEAVWISMACILDARLLDYIGIVITSRLKFQFSGTHRPEDEGPHTAAAGRHCYGLEFPVRC